MKIRLISTIALLAMLSAGNVMAQTGGWGGSDTEGAKGDDESSGNSVGGSDSGVSFGSLIIRDNSNNGNQNITFADYQENYLRTLAEFNAEMKRQEDLRRSRR